MPKNRKKSDVESLKRPTKSNEMDTNFSNQLGSKSFIKSIKALKSFKYCLAIIHYPKRVDVELILSLLSSNMVLIFIRAKIYH